MATKKAKNNTVTKVAEDVKGVAKTVAKEAAKEVKETAEKVAVKAEKVAVKAEKVAVKAEEAAVKAKKAAEKKEVKTALYVQCFGKEVSEKDMIASAKKAWMKETGKKASSLKSIALYVKPEEAAVYYVINGTDAGKVEF